MGLNKGVMGVWYSFCVQVQLYLPEEQHPAFGVVRAVVKDGSDADLGASSAVRTAGQHAWRVQRKQRHTAVAPFLSLRHSPSCGLHTSSKGKRVMFMLCQAAVDRVLMWVLGACSGVAGLRRPGGLQQREQARGCERGPRR